MDVKLDKFGEKTEIVHSRGRVGEPIIGYVIEDPRGWMALPTSVLKPPTKHVSRSDAIDYVRRHA